MIGAQLPNGFIDFSDTSFSCPHCKKKFDDVDDKYLKRVNKNKSSCAKVKCDCKETFSLISDYKGDFITFKK